MQINRTNISNKQQSTIANPSSSWQLTDNNQKFSGKLILRDQVSLSTDGLSQPEKNIVANMNNSVSRIVRLLGEMEKLSEIAEKNDISDTARLDLQASLIRIQANLHRETYSMGLSLAGMGYGDVSGQQESLGGARAFSTVSINDGFFVNDEGKNCVSYAYIHDAGSEIGPIWEKYADLNIGEIKIDLMPSDNIKPGKVTHLITLIEASEDPQTSKANDLIEKLLEAKISSVSLNDLLADESFSEGQQMELLTAKSATRFTNRINREINKLNNLREKFSAIDFSNRNTNLSVTDTIRVVADYTVSDKDSDSEGKIDSILGVMGLCGSGKCDIRLLAPSNQVAQMFQSMDGFLKDSVYKNLGIGDIWGD